MNYQSYYTNLMETILSKVPGKSVLANLLVDMLSLDKKAVYRRLRGEVPFTFTEVATISRNLDISLDTLIDLNGGNVSPFQMNLIEHANPSEMDYTLMEKVVGILDELKNESFSRGGEATYILPQPLYFPYESLSRYYLFKWMCQYGPVPYKEIQISPRGRKIQLENIKVARNVKLTDYIFDTSIFANLVEELKYFYYIHLISAQELKKIKEDIFCILDDLNSLTETGVFKDTGNTVRIYISDIKMDASYCFIETEQLKMTIVKAFILNGIVSYDEKTFKMLKNWLQSIKRQAPLISVNAEPQRIRYLNKQYALVKTL